MVSGLLVAGTTSDAGKSVVTTGLCRAFARRGVRVAPYKAQNMSNNSMVCAAAGGAAAEIGRAQWVQALAARVRPEPAMNPVLLKPGSDRRSHVVLMGRPAGTVDADNWEDGRRHLAAAAHAAYDDLAVRYDVIVAEGAGSPAEINLRAGDYVNMGLARHAGMPAVVVGDIDRGGVFAAMLGTVALLSAEDQALVAGFIVNKFRGEPSLLASGLRAIERVTGRRVYGVLPWHAGLWLDSEDALDLDGRRAAAVGARRVAVVRLPRISNFTDLDALGLEPALDVVFVSSARDLADADLVVLPGTRATIADLAWLCSRGLDRAITEHARRGRPVLGICGGCQMLGRTIADPEGIEGAPGIAVAGLGLLDLTTTFRREKTLRLSQPSGYEIHHGRIEGGTCDGVVTGTMVHGSLEDDATRAAYLAETLGVASAVSFPAARERRLDLLGDMVEEHLDIEALLALARDGAPAGLPVLPPGGVPLRGSTGTARSQPLTFGKIGLISALGVRPFMRLPVLPGQRVLDLALLGARDGGHDVRMVGAEEDQAAFLHHPAGREVDRHRVGDDFPDSEIGEALADERAGSLGGVALVPHRLAQPVAEVDGVRIAIRPEVEPAEELPGSPGLGRPEAPAVVALVKAEEERDDPHPHLVARSWLAAGEEPHDVGVAVEVVQVVGVVSGEGAQDKTGGLEENGHGCHYPRAGRRA